MKKGKKNLEGGCGWGCRRQIHKVKSVSQSKSNAMQIKGSTVEKVRNGWMVNVL